MKPGNPYGKDAFKYGSADWAARRDLEESRKPKPKPVHYNPPPVIPYNPPVTVGPYTKQYVSNDYGKRSSGLTDNLPQVSNKTLLTLAIIGFFAGASIAANSHSSPLGGALVGVFSGLLAIPLIVIAFRILKIVLALAAIILVFYLIVHSIGH